MTAIIHTEAILELSEARMTERWNCWCQRLCFELYTSVPSKWKLHPANQTLFHMKNGHFMNKKCIAPGIHAYLLPLGRLE